MPRKKKKVTKNINIEKIQEDEIKKRFGNEINFSYITRQLIKLGLTMLDYKIIPDLSDESIELVQRDILDKTTRNIAKTKVAEYKEVFEGLAKLGCYYVPEISSFPKVLMQIAGIYSDFNYEKILTSPLYDEMLKKVALRSHMIDSVEMRKENDIYIQFTGQNPFTLLWYTKMVTCVLAASQHHWEITGTFPDELNSMENLDLIRVNLKQGQSMEKSMKRVRETFSNIKIRIKDSNNSGVWNLLNEPINFILDRTCISYMEKKSEGIPFHHYIDDIQAIEQNPLNRCMLVMEFYKKINHSAALANLLRISV